MRTTRQQLPYILTGVLVLLAVAAIAVFLATDNTAQTTAPSPAPSTLGGSEIPQPTATPTAPQLGIEAKPLIAGPLPEPASAVGELVPGFPTATVSLPSGAEVVNSAIAIEGDRMQATVVATAAASEDDVHRYFDGIFTPLGLRGAETPSAAGTTAMTWSSGNDSIVVATTADGEGTRFSVLALLTAGTG